MMMMNIIPVCLPSLRMLNNSCVCLVVNCSHSLRENKTCCMKFKYHNCKITTNNLDGLGEKRPSLYFTWDWQLIVLIDPVKRIHHQFQKSLEKCAETELIWTLNWVHLNPLSEDQVKGQDHTEKRMNEPCERRLWWEWNHRNNHLSLSGISTGVEQRGPRRVLFGNWGRIFERRCRLWNLCYAYVERQIIYRSFFSLLVCTIYAESR